MITAVISFSIHCVSLVVIQFKRTSFRVFRLWLLLSPFDIVVLFSPNEQCKTSPFRFGLHCIFIDPKRCVSEDLKHKIAYIIFA